MPIADHLLFLRRFIQKPFQVAALAPSSRALSRAMVRGLEIRPGDAVIELGPGTGVFTRELIPLLPDPACYLGIDRDPDFIQLLRKRYPGLQFVEGRAEEIDRHAADAGLMNVKAVISGLPFAAMPKKAQLAIMNSVGRMLQPDSAFRTFQYGHVLKSRSARRFRAMMIDYFGQCTVSPMIWGNLPPAVVLSARCVSDGKPCDKPDAPETSPEPAIATQ